MWTFYAERELKVYELSEAIAISSTITKHAELEDSLYDEETIINITGNLLSTRTKAQNIYITPIHYSVHEYFTIPHISKRKVIFGSTLSSRMKLTVNSQALV